jgi:adenine-specific DNA-methyltransferase
LYLITNSVDLFGNCQESGAKNIQGLMENSIANLRIREKIEVTPPLTQNTPYRPIQYLGNKLRALSQIVEASEAVIGHKGNVVDLFSGTTVVAQAFANQGSKVTTVDTQEYSRVFAEALLGIGRKVGEVFDPRILSSVDNNVYTESSLSLWTSYIDREDMALERKDANDLAALTHNLPLIWRDPDNVHYHYICEGTGSSAFGKMPLIASTYSGTYFGVRQALSLDNLRQSIQTARNIGLLSKWQFSAALTAVLSAASAVVHSAGKHFAQPLNSGSSKNSRFLERRLLDDRTMSVEKEFLLACRKINDHASLPNKGHMAFKMTAESFMSNETNPADLYYLDPPYTAQQYSRFYHLLETICTYEFPQLLHDGKLTTGLYPNQRYKSDFSSRTKAAMAFGKLIEGAKKRNAGVLISYSKSTEDSQGNARMISLDHLVKICKDSFGQKQVNWHQLGHRYRQFNSASMSNSQRDDSEILITCKPR